MTTFIEQENISGKTI